MLVSACPPPARSCLAWQAGRLRLQARRAGLLFFKGNYLCLSSIKYPVSAHPGLNIRFQDFVFFGSGLSGLGLAEGFKYLILHQKKTV
jgi:hypothetical protein